jgi:putative ABC transport system substrate-binding protein
VSSPPTGRRAFLAASLAALASLTAPAAARGQATRTARIGVLGSTAEANFAPNLKYFRERLRQLGWIEGQNLVLDSRFASQSYEQLPALAAELVALKVDVVFALATPAIQAMKRATTSIPIVIETLGDAVAVGLVPSLARPGGNVTGVSGFAPELSGKRLELIREVLPGATRVALLANRSNATSAPIVRSTQVVAEQLRLDLRVSDVRSAAALEPAFEAMVRDRRQALVVAPDPLLFNQRRHLIELAERHRLPAVYENRSFVENGGLLAYGEDTHDRFARAAVYVDRILRGARPGDLPVEQPSTFELSLNLQTARRLGLTIPPAVRLRASHVIE